MKKALYITLATILFSMISPWVALATVCTPSTSATSCIGLPCSDVGQTTLDNDKINLLACLITSSTDPSFQWKALSHTSGSLGSSITTHYGDMGWTLLNCPPGYVMTGAGGWASTGTNIYMTCTQLN